MLRAIRRLCRCCRARKVRHSMESSSSKEEDSEGSGGSEHFVEDNYEIGEVIGQGRLGVVHKCIRRSTREQLACKKMPITRNALDEMLLLENHLSGKHPGILEVTDCNWGQLLGKYMSNNLYMISELCAGGDLQRFLERNGILSEKETAGIIKCVVDALRYCHSQSIIHRDVKPSSIFISNTADSSSSWVIKLGNFDRSIQLHDKYFAENDVPTENVGTLGYSAPEMLIGNGYSYEVDIWSSGVVLYFLLCGRTPFDAQIEDDMVMYEQIQNTELDLGTDLWSSVSDSAKELVLGMLEKDAGLRLSCDEILSHPWILDNVEMGVASSSSINTEIASTSTINPEIASTSINAEIASTSINTEIASTSRGAAGQED